jgi:putative pyruvate formate lyase activating enzyme
MFQYRPCGRAAEIPGLEAAVSVAECRRALREAMEEGITRFDQRPSLLRLG